MIRLLTVWIAAAALVLSAQTAKSLADGAQKMAKRALTDADIDIYCAIAGEIRKLTGPVRNAQDSNRMLEITRNTTAKHGLTHLEYGVLDSRVSMALLTLGMRMAIPEKIKPDCDLVAKHRARIEEARKFAK